MIAITNTSFEQELEENLATYTTVIPDHFASDVNLFSTRKEISIARYALSCQALAYKAAMEILLDQLSSQRTAAIADDQIMRNIMTLLAGIEQKSKDLIQSAMQVTALLGRAVEIDIDKSALRTLLVNTPAILEKTITQISGDPELASRISVSFNNKINDLMIQFRLNHDNDLPPSAQSEQNGISIIEYQELLGSVPTQPIFQHSNE